MTKRKLVMPKGDGRLELAIQSLKFITKAILG